MIESIEHTSLKPEGRFNGFSRRSTNDNSKVFKIKEEINAYVSFGLSLLSGENSFQAHLRKDDTVVSSLAKMQFVTKQYEAMELAQRTQEEMDKRLLEIVR